MLMTLQRIDVGRTVHTGHTVHTAPTPQHTPYGAPKREIKCNHKCETEARTSHPKTLIHGGSKREVQKGGNYVDCDTNWLPSTVRNWKLNFLAACSP